MHSRFGLMTLVSLLIGTLAFPASAQSFTAEQSRDLPGWLRAHVGEGEDQIAPLVLHRARALYQRKVAARAVRNPCYFAMDATRPHGSEDGGQGRRFYIICESERSFRAISSGHGGGRTLDGMADFRNGRRCAKHFSNALGSRLTAGGVYVTDETRTSFKGYYQASSGRKAALVRPFIPFAGEGETANAEQRAIGGHAAVLIKGACLLRDPSSPHANASGYVPLGELVDYSSGRSSGCTSWSPRGAREIVSITQQQPTSLYIYPEAADIEAVARAVAAGQSLSRLGLYWNASCLKEIGEPRFWPRQGLEPMLARHQRKQPPSQPASLPYCDGQ
ncbi:hypothetical protein Thiowin_01339 [Thiorhodovibrio winogradskyi]|uniref:YkuD domain-containing protein n=1 Tax=Thiorhodovibrio winogradskyi TaxID=77007 RepID=A0ABZ0S5T0_9GAMM|nr:hypothetical protein [Thiorhodovibrio winogradskyi]